MTVAVVSGSVVGLIVALFLEGVRCFLSGAASDFLSELSLLFYS